MYIMYVDESGDPGPSPPSPTAFYALSALVVHETRWLATLDALALERKRMRGVYGLKMRDEIHAAEFIRRPCGLTVPKWQRLQLLGDMVQCVAALPGASVLSVKVQKTATTTAAAVFETAWSTLLQRFHNTLVHNNFPAPAHAAEHGIVVADDTDERALRLLIRKKRRFNIVPGMSGQSARRMPLDRIAKDAIMRDSRHSYFVQAADVCAYFLHQLVAPNAYVRKQGAHNFYKRLAPVACCVASPGDPFGLGIVHR